MKLLGWPRTGLLALTAFAVIAVACGSPDPSGDAFVFTPVPYTVLPAEPGETPIVVALDDDGDEYLAAEVVVLLRLTDVDRFLAWLKGIGLDGQRLDEDLSDVNATRAAERGLVIDKASVLVIVPRGAAVAARERIATRPEVESVSLSYLRSTQ